MSLTESYRVLQSLTKPYKDLQEKLTRKLTVKLTVKLTERLSVKLTVKLTRKRYRDLQSVTLFHSRKQEYLD